MRLDGRRRPDRRGGASARPGARRRRGCPAWCCPASRTPTRTPSTARCAAAPTTRGGTFWTWRERMYAVAGRLDPDSYLALARADLRRDGAGRDHLRRRVPLPAPRPGGTPYADPNAMGEALVQAARRRRHPAHPARHLLPGRRPRGDGYLPLDGVQRAVRRRRRRRLGRPGRRCCPSAPGCGSAPPSTRCARCRPTAAPTVAGPPAGPAAARAPVRAAGRERGLPRPPTAARPTRLLADARRCSARAHRRARHPPHRRRRRRCSARSGTAVCACPTTERDLADGIGPVRRAARRRLAALPRQRPARRHRPARGGPRARDATSGWPRGERGRFARPSCSTPLTVDGHRALGWPDAGRLAPGQRADLVAVRLDTPAHRRLRTRPGCVLARRRRRRAHRGRRRPGRRVATGGTCSATSAGCCAAAIEPLWEDRMSTLITGIGELVTNDPALDDGPLGVLADAALVVEDGRVAWVGPAAATPRPPTRRVDVGGARGDPGLRRQPRPPGLRRRPGGRVRGPDGGRPLRRRRHRHHRRRHPGGDRRRAARPAARAWSPRCARQGTTTVEIKSGYGLTVEDEARCAAAGRARSPPETTFLGAHVVPAGVRRPAGRLRRPGLPARCSPPARRTPAGSTCSASPARRTPSTATRPARCSRRAGTRGLGLRVHANQLGRARACGSPSSSARASADHCTHLTDADVDALAGGDDGRDPAARRGVLDPLALPGRPPAARRRRDGRAGHRLQPGHLLHLVDAVLHRARRPGDADDAGRGAVGGDRRRRARRCAATTSATWRPARGPTSPSSTRRPTCTSPTAPACRSPARSNCRPDRGAAGRTRRAPGAGSAR